MISGQPHVRVLRPASREADPSTAADAAPASPPSTRIPSVRVIPSTSSATAPPPTLPATRQDPAGNAPTAAPPGGDSPTAEPDLGDQAPTVALPRPAAPAGPPTGPDPSDSDSDSDHGVPRNSATPADDDDGAGPLWAALREERFVLSRCLDCHSWLPPRLERCRHCAGPTAFEPADGLGVVDSYLVIRHPSMPAFAGRPPYVLALVTLDEGVRLPGRLDGVAPGEARIGQPVRAAFHVRSGADAPSVVFRPRQPAAAGAR
ncbi:Zn-ribbon domain-containing OB-fold protein [Frankia gtarii]|uniref:Zn-ribbon domain-containing OB-fold protein n=1 Tax=Frankia gtarii TaxID=2950102 RepID=UPI0021BF83DF|nr:OB-fold domain-containing protein [Frankia gtarii]